MYCVCVNSYLSIVFYHHNGELLGLKVQLSDLRPEKIGEAISFYTCTCNCYSGLLVFVLIPDTMCNLCSQ